jgi:hypothetical protein
MIHEPLLGFAVGQGSSAFHPHKEKNFGGENNEGVRCSSINGLIPYLKYINKTNPKEQSAVTETQKYKN